MLEAGKYCSAGEAAAFCSVLRWKKRRLTKEYHSSEELWLLYITNMFNFWEGSQKENHKTSAESGLWAEIGHYIERQQSLLMNNVAMWIYAICRCKSSMQDEIYLKFHTCLLGCTYLTFHYLAWNKWKQSFFFVAHQKVLKDTRRDCLPDDISRVWYFYFILLPKRHFLLKVTVLCYVPSQWPQYCFVSVWTWHSMGYILPNSFNSP